MFVNLNSFEIYNIPELWNKEQILDLAYQSAKKVV